MPELELRLRQRSELLKAMITAIGTLSHTTTAAQRTLSDRVAGCGDLGSAAARLGAYEEAAAHRELGHVVVRFSGACLGVAESCAPAALQAGGHARVRTTLRLGLRRR